MDEMPPAPAPSQPATAPAALPPAEALPGRWSGPGRALRSPGGMYLRQELRLLRPIRPGDAVTATVNARAASTLDAAALCKMADRGQISGGVLDGPLAFDNAVNPAAAAEKGIVSPVAGQADILVVPDLEAGNMLAKQMTFKQMTFLAGADAAGAVLGARVPIVLTSRVDLARTRLASCAVAVRLARAGAQAGVAPEGAA